MFLHSPMPSPEFMRVPLKFFPPDIIKRYNLMTLVHTDGHVYIKIKKGMYGLKQAALLAYQHLSTILKNGGFFPLPNSLGLWTHKTRNILFCLCVDDFGIKYFNDDDLHHLKQTVEKGYTCKLDLTGRNFLGFTLNWNYEKAFVDISMPNNIDHALQ